MLVQSPRRNSRWDAHVETAASAVPPTAARRLLAHSLQLSLPLSFPFGPAKTPKTRPFPATVRIDHLSGSRKPILEASSSVRKCGSRESKFGGIKYVAIQKCGALDS